MKKTYNRILTSSGAWCSVLTAVGVMTLVCAASADNLKLNRHFNQKGNVLISDQFNNRTLADSEWVSSVASRNHRQVADV